MNSIDATALLNSISDAFMALDDDLVVTFFNDAAECILGRKREEVLGRPLFDSFPEAKGSTFERNYRKGVDERRALSFETFFDIEPYRNWYDVRVYPAEEGICVFFQVSSKLKKLELGLRRINDCILGLGSNYAASIDDLTRLAGEVLDADFSVYRALKGDSLQVAASWNLPEELSTMEMSKDSFCHQLVLGSDERYLLATDLLNAEKYKDDRAIQEMGLRTYLGHVIHSGEARTGIMCCCYKREVKLSDDDVELLKIIAAAVGAVETRREKEQLLVNSNQMLQDALDHLRQAQDDLVKKERLSALGQMVSGIAHDFNNALMPVLGISDLLLESPELLDDKDQLKADIGMIRDSAERATNTVKSLREFYKPLHDEAMEGVEFAKLIEDAVKATEYAWKVKAMEEERPIEVKVMTGPMPLSLGSRSGIMDCLSNLILNAVDAMPHGGVIKVRGWYEEDNINISVSDTGIGMAEEVRSHCLEPFFTTKYASGTGLGLARSYGIVTRHGGTMSVDSAPGKGTEVLMRLLHRAPDITAEEDGGSSSGHEGNAVKMLVVDDDEATRYLMAKLLSSIPGRCDACASGEEALEQFGRVGYDLVITDKAMPKMDGEDLARRIKELNGAAKVIMLTGYGDLMDENNPPAGVDILLTKPVSHEQLSSSIERVMHLAGGPR